MSALAVAQPGRRTKPDPSTWTRQPVRGRSLLASKFRGRGERDWEEDFNTELSRDDLYKLEEAAVLFNNTDRDPDAYDGRIGRIGFLLLRKLAELVRTGYDRLTFPVAWLAKEVGCSEASIHVAKEKLREHGFLIWARRCVPDEGKAETRSPPVRQTSNIYQLLFPAAARALLGQRGQKRLPDDEKTRKAAVARQLHLMALQQQEIDIPAVAAAVRHGREAEHTARAVRPRPTPD